MTAPEFTLVAPEPAAALGQMRVELYARFSSGNVVRDECYRLALSAAVWRLVHFGAEGAFTFYTARDLANFTLVAEGGVVDFLVRAGFTRALIDDDADMLALYERLGLANAGRDWSARLHECPRDEAIATVAAITDAEEQATARLVLARRFPDTIAPAWLWAVPTTTPTIAYALCLLILRVRTDLLSTVAAYLQQNRAVLLVREPDELLALLVGQASTHPQTTLAPFAGFYGEATVVAAAAWHLEHDEPDAAHALVAGFRPLSTHADRAWLIAALVALARNRLDEVQQLRGLIQDHGCRAQVILRLAEYSPSLVNDTDLLALLDGCTADEPELFYRGLLCLLNRKQLTAARHLAARRQLDFQHHPQLGPIITAVLTGKAAAAALH